MKAKSLFLLLVFVVVAPFVACADAQPVFKNDGVYQWSVESTPPDTDRQTGRAYLWIPEMCSRLRGVVIGQQNMLEEPIFATRAFRAEMAKAEMGIVFIAPIQCGIYHFTSNESKWLEDILSRLADISGYDELKKAPVAFIGHSAMAMWPYFGASTWGDRAICGISLKGAWADMSKDWAKESVGRGLAGVPFLLLDGEYEDAHGRGERSLKFCATYPDVPFSFCAEDGAGHFDWSDELAGYLGLYIRKAASARFPSIGAAKARFVEKKGGTWLPLWRRYEVEAPAVPSTDPIARGYWFFDSEMALATVKLQERFRRQTKTPLVSIEQDGAVVPQQKTHLQVHPKFRPIDGEGGVRFSLKPVFIEDVEQGRLADWTGLKAGSKAPHPASAESLYLQLICGPAIKVGKDTYEIRLDRGSVYRNKLAVTLQAIFPGDETYQRAVQQASMSVYKPKGKGNGKTYHFVREGAATIDDDGTITFLKLPPRAKRPHVITVCDYEWSDKAPVFREVPYGTR